jgi:histidinol dehydrogenase
LEATAKELERQVANLSRSEETIQSLRDFGCLILVRDEEQACRIADLIAPEHLHIAIDNGERLLSKIHNAGATFLGNFSPVALGDYAAGPSHVLPTGGTARWASGLSANHFLRSSSVIEYSSESLDAIALDVIRMAEVEGLTAHRASVQMRAPPAS